MVKKRLALASALLLAVLIVAVVVGGRDMGICDIKYELITPDGQTFNFWGVGRAPGSEATLQAHEGFGLPPVRHVTQDIYNVPGNLLVDVVVQGRTVTITESVYATDATRKGLHKALAEIWDAVRWDRGATRTTPSILRYTVDGNSWDLYVVLSGVVEGRQGRYGRNEIVGLRFEAHDPLWWDDAESLLTLDWQDAFTSRYILGKIGGVWDPMGPPTAGGTVSTIAVNPDTGDVVVGGTFAAWDGLPGVTGDNVVMWDVSAQAWVAIGGGLNSSVRVLYFATDGTLYAGGAFTDGSGGAGDPAADYIAQYDVLTDTWVNVGGGPGVGAVTDVWDIVEGYDGQLYVIGDFTNWDGLGSPTGDHIVQLPLGGAWATVGNGLNQMAYTGVIALNGNLIVGGFFGIAGGVPCSYIAEWDGTAWAPLGAGTNGTVLDAVFGLDGTLFACGVFTTAGGQTVNYVASWNGTSWSDLDGGFDSQAWRMAVADDGTLYVVGAFAQAGALTLTDRAARWNGFSWAHLAFDLPGAPTVRAVAVDGEDLYFGWDNVGTVLVAGDNSVVTTGSAATLPVIEIKNQGLVRSIRNETTGDELLFDMQMLDGEIVIVDLSTGRKTVTSNRRGNRLNGLIPPGVGAFELESYPRAYYGGTVKGTNLITVFITDADPREHNDDNNQLSDWANVTGIKQTNTDLGRLYVTIVDEGAGANFHVEFYQDAARTELVGHTGSYPNLFAGPIAIVADNTSGLGGSITVDATVAADVDIEVYFTIVTMTWHNKWWSVDEAILAAE